MKPSAVLLSLLITAYVSPALSQELCSEIIPKGGAIQQLNVRAKQELETLDLRNFSQSNSNGTNFSGKYGAYSGSYSQNRKTALQDNRFDWSRSGSELEYSLSSGDKTIVDGWLACMQRQSGGISAWFEAPDRTNLWLHMIYIPNPQAIDARRTATLVSDVDITKAFPGLQILDRAECLKAGYELTNIGCAVHFTGVDPDKPISTQIATRTDRPSQPYLPRRLYIKETARVGDPVPSIERHVGPAQNMVFDIPVYLPEGWYIEDGTVVLSLDKTSGPATRCRATATEFPAYFVVHITVDSESNSLGAGCWYTPTYRMFRFDPVPIN